jgi:hypothetical protein
MNSTTTTTTAADDKYTEMDYYFADQLAELLYKLGLRSAEPRDADEAIRRYVNTNPASFSPVGLEGQEDCICIIGDVVDYFIGSQHSGEGGDDDVQG